MSVKYEIRHAAHPGDAARYDTQRLRKEHLVENVFVKDEINVAYSLYDRYIVGGAFPVSKPLCLETIEPLKAPNFLHRREMGVINTGDTGKIQVGIHEYLIGHKEALYIGSGDHEVTFAAVDGKRPPKFYINSAPAHKSFPTRKITLKDAIVLEAGAAETSNARRINRLLVREVLETCQLQMGMTELQPGSVWNTMPAHTHLRRMEAYFYFEVPDGQAICHFMGEPNETRHIWMHNEQAVISPPWSIHSAAGTNNYTFIWGMAGENLAYDDMDTVQPGELL
ncbi:MAG: 5-dehydro-4-deoxy-D-glucuronate isomerase [Bacteroidales bacterium]|jgi:4-deoxy-L-threo-5-hexosulose-uronate ketol-isomerase|nr:5-dehydro-4-deoxy-D-glucuronate isomerase [Bacteroidales bacterium]